MILVNTDYITGKELEMLGLVKGSTIQSKNVGRDITQSLKTLVGGELKAYNEMMTEARALATKRMVMEAESMGADAVVNVRYASSAVMQGAAEVIAYGTAVKFKYTRGNFAPDKNDPILYGKNKATKKSCLFGKQRIYVAKRKSNKKVLHNFGS